MNESSRIFVAGHRGLVGGAIMRALETAGHRDLITATRTEVDLREQQATRDFLARTKPQFVFLPAAHVGGLPPTAPTPSAPPSLAYWTFGAV